jgi:hypothetical protein
MERRLGGFFGTITLTSLGGGAVKLKFLYGRTDEHGAPTSVVAAWSVETDRLPLR